MVPKDTQCWAQLSKLTLSSFLRKKKVTGSNWLSSYTSFMSTSRRRSLSGSLILTWCRMWSSFATGLKTLSWPLKTQTSSSMQPSINKNFMKSGPNLPHAWPNTQMCSPIRPASLKSFTNFMLRSAHAASDGAFHQRQWSRWRTI